MNTEIEKLQAVGHFILWLWKLPVSEDNKEKSRRWNYTIEELKMFGGRGQLKQYVEKLPVNYQVDGADDKYGWLFDIRKTRLGFQGKKSAFKQRVASELVF